ncbi:MAG: AgmX/PglI C-terminal domain-containing protein [Deltaproteobacteria bacterium]|nr:AgmX/PglI C-terminal domain-containing protein [Deltaproteobacteria bacterium]
MFLKAQPRTLLTGAVVILAAIYGFPGCANIGASPDAAATGMPSEGPLGRTMNRHSESFARCGRDSVSVQTGSVQRVKLKFTVTPDGRASKAEVLGMSDPDPDLQYCLLKTLGRIEFPKPKDGQAKPVLYPVTIRQD